MKTEKNILIAFILNLGFSIFEIFGGLFTGSIAILTDSIHDFGDALSIGLSYFLEKISKMKPNKTHTYGYVRYSVIGSLITSTMLLVGSVFHKRRRFLKSESSQSSYARRCVRMGCCLNWFYYHEIHKYLTY